MHSFRPSIPEPPPTPAARRFSGPSCEHAVEMSVSIDAHAGKESPVLSVRLLMVSMLSVISWIASLSSGPQVGAAAVVTIRGRDLPVSQAGRWQGCVLTILLLCPAYSGGPRWLLL